MNPLRNLTKIVRNMKIVNNRLYHETDMNENTYECLRYITKHPGITSKQLCDYLAVDKALITRMVKKLEQEQYIEIIKDSGDHRRKGIFPLIKAYTLKETRANHETEFIDNCLADLTKEEKQLYLELTNKVYLRSKQLRKETNKR